MRHVPPRVLGSAVGGLIILTNVRTLLRSDWIGAPDAVRYGAYAAICLLWFAAVGYSVRAHRTEQVRQPASAPATVG